MALVRIDNEVIRNRGLRAASYPISLDPVTRLQENMKKSNEAAAVAAYRVRTERRRLAKINARSTLAVPPTGVNADSNKETGVVTVQKPADAKPVATLGGATKVFGKSSFAIPEFRIYAKRSVR